MKRQIDSSLFERLLLSRGDTLRKRVKQQEKEIRRLKEENEFLAEASAFFAASRRKSAKGSE